MYIKLAIIMKMMIAYIVLNTNLVSSFRIKQFASSAAETNNTTVINIANMTKIKKSKTDISYSSMRCLSLEPVIVCIYSVLSAG